MKIMKGIIVALICLTLTSVSAQQTIEGVTLPATVTVEGETLNLNGGGLREKLWFNLYVGGLYLKTASSDAQAIIAKDESMSIHLEITSKMISSENLTEAIVEGFDKSTNGNTEVIKEEIKTFLASFKEEIVVGNKFDISYKAGMGVLVKKNGKLLTTIDGFGFKKALFGIWLGEKPADKKLKAGMLNAK